MFGHPGAKGNVSEGEWVALLQKHLPERYRVDNAFVIDSEGHISQQIDVVVYDRHFTPELYLQQGERLIPAESVYAVYEGKPNLSAEHVAYAREKVTSVRGLTRTSAPIYHAGGTFPPGHCRGFWGSADLRIRLQPGIQSGCTCYDSGDDGRRIAASGLRCRERDRAAG